MKEANVEVAVGPFVFDVVEACPHVTGFSSSFRNWCWASMTVDQTSSQYCALGYVQKLLK